MPGGPSAGGRGRDNLLLHALVPVAQHLENARLKAELELVELELHEVVHEAGAPVTDVYFPQSAVFGLLSVVPGAPPTEVMPVGSEGVVGLPAVLGDGISPHRVLCQVPGQAVRLPVGGLREQIDASEPVRRLLGRYNQMTIVLLTARVVCHQRHTAEQRCADWLLRRSDQIGGGQFPVTQRFLASMLGLRRTTVSAVATRLQDLQLIRYGYGRVTVTDHPGLERLSCSCYGLFRRQVDELTAATLPHTGPGLNGPSTTVGLGTPQGVRAVPGDPDGRPVQLR